MVKKTTRSGKPASSGAKSTSGGKSSSGVGEVKRFTTDLSANRALLQGVVDQGGGLEAVVKYANGHGYRFTVKDATRHLSMLAGRELNDTELDAIALGKGAVTTNIVVFTQGVIATDVAVGGELAAIVLAVAAGTSAR